MGYEQNTDIFFLVFVIVGAVLFFRHVFKGEAAPPPGNEKDDGAPGTRNTAAPPASVRSAPAARAPGAPGEVTGIFVVVTAPDPQVQTMAMSLSLQVLNRGKTIHILLCGPAGELAVKGSAETVLKPLNKSPQELLRGFLKKNITVEVCPFFIANSDWSEADLLPGVGMAKPPDVAAGMLEPGVKLFTF